MSLKEESGAFLLNCFEFDWAEIFFVMADVGFFTETGDRYRMTIPRNLKIEQVTDALLRLAATEDAECFLHPERLLTTMTERQASSQKENLEGSISFRRVAYEKAILARSAIKIEDKADAGLE